MKYLATLVATMVLLTVVGVAPVAAVNTGDYDYKVAHSSERNQASWWEDHFEKQGYVNVTCTKYGSSHSGWLPANREAGIIKAGAWNYVWVQTDDVGRQLNAPQELSHIIKCDWDKEYKKKAWNPQAKLKFCADPRMLITANNTKSEIPALYEVTYRSGKDRSKITFTRRVKAGEKDVLFPRWIWGRTFAKVVVRPAIIQPAVHPPMYETKVLYAQRIPKTTPWGTNGCPSSLKAAYRIARYN